MYVYLQAYAGGPSTPVAPSSPGAKASAPSSSPPQPPPLVAMVSLYRNHGRAYQTGPIAVRPAPASRLGVVPLSFHFGLGSLAPGQYDCQVTVLDPAGNRAAFWVNPILIVR